ncbi:MAG: glycosyltransferase family 2 protein [Sedimentisphaerales bacterium]|nr:glycosyltransferase family 2 protein [Sedimentisphaerales bacterium]
MHSNHAIQKDTVSDRKDLSISVFFPCHNEGASIEELVRRTCDFLSQQSDDFEILIIDDGSTDETGPIADRLAREISVVRVVHHPVNRGYGGALQSGFRAAVKEWVFYTDGDAQFDIYELDAILPLRKQYDIVSCYRLNRQEGWRRKWNAWCWSKLVGLLLGFRLKDVDCAFKLFRRRIFEGMEMKSAGALIDAEILARAKRRGYTIVQQGVHHYPRRAGRPSGAKLSVIVRAFQELFRLRNDILRESRP